MCSSDLGTLIVRNPAGVGVLNNIKANDGSTPVPLSTATRASAEVQRVNAGAGDVTP